MAADPFAEQDVQCIATNHVGRAPWQTEQRMLAGRVLYGLLVRGEAVILFTNVQCLHVFPRLARAQLCIALEMLFRVLAGLCLVVVQHSTTNAANASFDFLAGLYCNFSTGNASSRVLAWL